jgi:hypothetical protein
VVVMCSGLGFDIGIGRGSPITVQVWPAEESEFSRVISSYPGVETGLVRVLESYRRGVTHVV